MNNLYVLVDRKPVKANLFQWAKWFEYEGDKRIVEQTTVNGVDVSTVFLGIGISHGDREPLLFETMVFGGSRDRHAQRYATWQEAKDGHDALVRDMQQAAHPKEEGL